MYGQDYYGLNAAAYASELLLKKVTKDAVENIDCMTPSLEDIFQEAIHFYARGVISCRCEVYDLAL